MGNPKKEEPSWQKIGKSPPQKGITTTQIWLSSSWPPQSWVLLTLNGKELGMEGLKKNLNSKKFLNWNKVPKIPYPRREFKK